MNVRRVAILLSARACPARAASPPPTRSNPRTRRAHERRSSGDRSCPPRSALWRPASRWRRARRADPRARRQRHRAAIAANATIGLMEPTGNGLGGDLFIIYYEAKTGTVHGLNSSGWAPTGLTRRLSSRRRASRRCRSAASTRSPCPAWPPAGTRCAANSAPSRSRSCWRRRSTTPRTASRSRRRIASQLGRLREDAQRASRTRARPIWSTASARRRRARCSSNPDLAGSLRLIAEKGRDGYYTRQDRRSDCRDLTRAGRHVHGRRPRRVPARMGHADQDQLPRLERLRDRPADQGISALMMLNLMEPYPMADYGFHSTNALHVMIEAKKLAYADMLQLHRRSAVHAQSGRRAPEQAARDRSRKLIDHSEGRVPGRAGEAARHHRRAGQRHDLHVRDRQGRQHRLVDPEQLQRLRLRPGAAGHGLHAAEPRRAVLARRRTSRTRSRRTSGRCTRSFPRSWRRAISGSASASWADGTRARRTRSLSPTSSTTA